MHMAIGAGALMAAGVMPIASVSAQTLKEIRAREAEERKLDREVSFTESVCGNSISATIDWRSTANWPDGVSIATACDGALGAVEAMCRSRNGGSRGPSINRFVCAGDGAGASVRGNTLRYGATPGGNGFAETKAALDQAQ